MSYPSPNSHPSYSLHLNVHQPAEVLPARSALPRDKRGAQLQPMNFRSSQNRSTPRRCFAAIRHRPLPLDILHPPSPREYAWQGLRRCVTSGCHRCVRRRTVAGLAFRTRRAGGRGQRMRPAGDSRAHPHHAARVRRYSIRPLDITSSIPTPARRRNAARARSADYRCHTPPPRRHSLRRGRSRGYAHLGGSLSMPSPFKASGCCLRQR